MQIQGGPTLSLPHKSEQGDTHPMLPFLREKKAAEMPRDCDDEEHEDKSTYTYKQYPPAPPDSRGE